MWCTSRDVEDRFDLRAVNRYLYQAHSALQVECDNYQDAPQLLFGGELGKQRAVASVVVCTFHRLCASHITS